MAYYNEAEEVAHFKAYVVASEERAAAWLGEIKSVVASADVDRPEPDTTVVITRAERGRWMVITRVFFAADEVMFATLKYTDALIIVDPDSAETIAQLERVREALRTYGFAWDQMVRVEHRAQPPQETLSAVTADLIEQSVILS